LPELGRFDREFLRAVLVLAAKGEVDHLLYISDYPLAAEDLRGRPIKRKLIYAVTHDGLAADLRDKGFAAVVIPDYEYSRLEQVKVALVAAGGLIKDGETLLCLTGAGKVPDTLIKLRMGTKFDEELTLESIQLGPEYDQQVVEQVVRLALEVGQEGFEGHPVGTLVTVGDSTAVMEKSKQLTINPFQGISETERNILDPTIRDAVKNFAVLDGAFVIREDGVVLAAGRYLQAGAENVKIPMGLGARHAAAAFITATTRAIAVVVSQSTGGVRIFKGGDIVLEMHPKSRRI
jgi:DNA integrity scanning protein DisA with diadenylate cyclase activity